MANNRVKESATITSTPPWPKQSRSTGEATEPVAWMEDEGERRLPVLENDIYRVSLWTEMRGAVTTTLTMGFVTTERGPWSQPKGKS